MANKQLKNGLKLIFIILNGNGCAAYNKDFII